VEKAAKHMDDHRVAAAALDVTTFIFRSGEMCRIKLFGCNFMIGEKFRSPCREPEQRCCGSSEVVRKELPVDDHYGSSKNRVLECRLFTWRTYARRWKDTWKVDSIDFSFQALHW
jgi:hypothetical protein